MALRQSLARGLAHWGRPVGQQVASLCTETACRTLAPAKGKVQSAGSSAAAAASAWQQAGGLRCLLRLPAAAEAGSGTAAGLRHYSSSARESFQDAAQRLKAAAASSTSAVKAAGSTVAKAPAVLYKALPTSAKQLVNATQTPGAINRVVSLQLTAFWQNNSNTIIAAGAVVLCYAIWRAMYKTSQAFVSLSDTMAASGFFAMAASFVVFGYLYLRRRYTIAPHQVYRLAMYRLNTHPGLLEVMGAPLVGSPVQASVLTGGSIHFKGLRPKLQSKRLQMIFPLKGAERRGLVSLEAKKRHGELRFKLLAVDVPCVAGGEQRIYLEGGPALYDRGGVLSVLRDPFIRALSMEDAFLAEDLEEDREEERQQHSAAAQRAQQAAAKQPKPMDQGGGLYFYEKVFLGAKQAAARWASRQRQAAAARAEAATARAQAEADAAAATAAAAEAEQQQPPAAGVPAAARAA